MGSEGSCAWPISEKCRGLSPRKFNAIIVPGKGAPEKGPRQGPAPTSPKRPSPMSRKPPKTAVVAFKVEEELAEFLNKLPNKSAFIRKAIAAQLGMACPLCNGSGVVPRGVHDHYAPLLRQFNLRQCDGCGHELPLPREPDDLSLEDRTRLEQFFHGGPLYC